MCTTVHMYLCVSVPHSLMNQLVHCDKTSATPGTSARCSVNQCVKSHS